MEVKYRHNGPLKDVDLHLLYNGQKETGGHYSSLFRTDGQFLEGTELFVSDNYYDEEIDKEEREFRGEGSSIYHRHIEHFFTFEILFSV